MDGWIKLHRKLKENPIVSKIELLGLFTYILLNANYKTKEMFIGNTKITIEKGQYFTSMKKMAKTLEVNRTTLGRWLKILENEQILNIKTTSKYTVMTINNWDKYQNGEHQMNIKRTSNEHQMNTTKKEKKEKKEKNIDTNVSRENLADKDSLTSRASKPESNINLGTGLNGLIGLFRPVNPSYKRLFANKTQRNALNRMVEEHGYEKVEQAIRSLPLVVGKQYAPTITTPYELEQKMGSLIAYLQREQGGHYKFSVEKV